MKLILASQSPRRRELLGLFHIPFEIRVADIDEAMDPTKAPADEVARVSREKAQAVERIPDKLFIEKCLMTLDEQDIELLFELFPRKRIRSVWRERMAIQGDHMLALNVAIATKYFGIKEPEKYLARAEQLQTQKLLKYIKG